jgi:hypothetical protein
MTTETAGPLTYADQHLVGMSWQSIHNGSAGVLSLDFFPYPTRSIVDPSSVSEQILFFLAIRIHPKQLAG